SRATGRGGSAWTGRAIRPAGRRRCNARPVPSAAVVRVRSVPVFQVPCGRFYTKSAARQHSPWWSANPLFLMDLPMPGGNELWFNAGMPAAFPTVALIGKYKTPEIAEPVLALARFLEKRGVR